MTSLQNVVILLCGITLVLYSPYALAATTAASTAASTSATAATTSAASTASDAATSSAAQSSDTTTAGPPGSDTTAAGTVVETTAAKNSTASADSGFTLTQAIIIGSLAAATALFMLITCCLAMYVCGKQQKKQFMQTPMNQPPNRAHLRNKQPSNNSTAYGVERQEVTQYREKPNAFWGVQSAIAAHLDEGPPASMDPTYNTGGNQRVNYERSFNIGPSRNYAMSPTRY